MKKLKLVLILFIVIIFANANATFAAIIPEPSSNIYKEGIYHFDKSVGNKINLNLITKDKPANVIIITNNNLKYYFYLDENMCKTTLYLENSIAHHTAVLIGEGEVSFTFE